MTTLRNELIPTNINADLRRGGWLATGRIEGDTDLVARYDNWLINVKSLASYIDASWITALDCHILGNPDFQFGAYDSTASLSAGTADRFLEGEHLQDISFAARGSPANSHEATSWDFGEIITHILQHHTNYIYDATGAAGSPDGWIVNTNIDTTNSYTFSPNEHFIVDQSDNLWRVIQQIGGGEEGGGEFYRPYFDKNNKFIYQPAPPFQSLTAKGTINKNHIRGIVRINFRNNEPTGRIGQVKLSAIGTSTTIYNASYPTNPGNGRIIDKNSGIWADTQARTNTLAERLYRWLTREWTIQVEVDPGLVLVGEDGNGLDIGQKVLLTYDGPAEDTATGAGVHLTLAAQSCFIYTIDIRPDIGNKSATAFLTLEHDNSA